MASQASGRKSTSFGKWLAEAMGIEDHKLSMSSTLGGKLWSSRGLQTVVSVCEKCNTGWMSDLEGRFGSRFGKAVLGHPDTFNAADLTTLAHWAAKTAIMLQPHLAGIREISHVPSGHMVSLPFGIPASTRVWLGAYGPPTRYVFWHNVPMALANATDPGWSGYIVLMTVGHMMMVVLGMDAEYGDKFIVTGLPDGIFRPTWPLPPSVFHWPDGVILNDRGIATFWPPKPGALVAVGTHPRPSHH